jgi:hypothetical protein
VSSLATGGSYASAYAGRKAGSSLRSE